VIKKWVKEDSTILVEIANRTDNPWEVTAITVTRTGPDGQAEREELTPYPPEQRPRLFRDDSSALLGRLWDQERVWQRRGYTLTEITPMYVIWERWGSGSIKHGDSVVLYTYMNDRGEIYQGKVAYFSGGEITFSGDLAGNTLEGWRLLLTEGHRSMQEEGYGEPEPLIDFWEEQTQSLPRL